MGTVLVDLDRSPLDAIDPRGAAQKVRPPDQDFAGTREREARLAATEDDLLLRGQDQLLAVQGRLDDRPEDGRRNNPRLGWLRTYGEAKDPENDRLAEVTGLKRED